MGIILSAMAAAGDAGAQSINQNIAMLNQQDLDKSRSELEQQKQLSIMKATADLANAPANRAGALVADSSSGQVQAQAAPVTQLSGGGVKTKITNSDGSPTPAFQGDYQAWKDRLSVISDPVERANALAQLDRQKSSDQATAQAGAGIRSRTSQEAIADAYSKAVASGDVQAATALKAMIPDKTIKVSKDEAIVDAANPSHVIFSNTAGTDKERLKIEADRNLQDVKGRQEAILKAMQLDPLGVNAPAGGYMKALSGDAGTQPSEQDTGSTLSERLQGKTGDDAMRELPGPIASRVKAILDGRESFPSTARNNPRNAQLLDLAAQVDPSFDAVNFNKRNQTAAAFAKGKQADAVRAANQAVAHAGSLYDSIEKLDNFSGIASPLNYIVNPAEKFFGDSRQGVFQQKAVAVASELRKVFSGGGGGSLSELRSWEESLPVNASQVAQKAYLISGMELLHGAIDNLQTQYEAGMGKTSGMTSLITPKSQAILDKINGNAVGTAAFPSAGPGNPAPDGIPDGWTVKVH